MKHKEAFFCAKMKKNKHILISIYSIQMWRKTVHKYTQTHTKYYTLYKAKYIYIQNIIYSIYCHNKNYKTISLKNEAND